MMTGHNLESMINWYLRTDGVNDRRFKNKLNIRTDSMKSQQMKMGGDGKKLKQKENIR